MPTLIRRLRLAGVSAGHEEEMAARKQMITAALQALAEIRARGAREERGIYDGLESHYRRRLASIDQDSAEPQRPARKIDHQLFVAQELRDVERAVALQLRDKNQIHDEVLRRLEHELDLLDARFAESEQ